MAPKSFEANLSDLQLGLLGKVPWHCSRKIKKRGYAAQDHVDKFVPWYSCVFRIFSFWYKFFSASTLKKTTKLFMQPSCQSLASCVGMKLQQREQVVKLLPRNLHVCAAVLCYWSAQRCPTIKCIAAATQCPYSDSISSAQKVLTVKNEHCPYHAPYW